MLLLLFLLRFIVVIIVFLSILRMFTTVAILAGNRPVAGRPGAGAAPDPGHSSYGHRQ